MPGNNVHRLSDRFHYSPRNNKKIVRGEISVQGNLNDLPIREYLVTKFSLIYRFWPGIRGVVAGKGRNMADRLPGGVRPHPAEPRQTGLPSVAHNDRVKKFNGKWIAHPWQVVSVRNIKSLSY
ncbi:MULTISPECIES: hypothetical protein [unclassified Burkholderia]|uniref:hypothetical protein n=1 Tax=unclassified Burkholderia TaxID=2613784 RepID=UPI0016246DDA|nr:MULTISPECIES: hypothetical protein [unclassified Burkholderia]